MKISELWLREFASPPGDTAALVHQLTMQGLEVESIEAAGPSLDGVVVGRVLDVAPHPNADRLRVCQVDVGTGTVQIVCGAANVRRGRPLSGSAARARSCLAAWSIGRAALRGVESGGMLCSAAELGLGEAWRSRPGRGSARTRFRRSSPGCPGRCCARSSRTTSWTSRSRRTGRTASPSSVWPATLPQPRGSPLPSRPVPAVPPQDGGGLPVRVEDPVGQPVVPGPRRARHPARTQSRPSGFVSGCAGAESGRSIPLSISRTS